MMQNLRPKRPESLTVTINPSLPVTELMAFIKLIESHSAVKSWTCGYRGTVCDMRDAQDLLARIKANQ